MLTLLEANMMFNSSSKLALQEHSVARRSEIYLDDFIVDPNARLAHVVTDLDGNPAAPETITYQERVAACRAAFVHPAADNDDSDVIELEFPARLMARPPRAPLKRDLVTRQGAARFRKSTLRDREDAASRRAYRSAQLGRQGSATGASSAAHPIPPHAPSDNSPTRTRKTKDTSAKSGRKKTSRARHVASWDEAGDLGRLAYVNDAITLRGKRYAFTLDLTPDVIQAANDSGRGPLDFYWRSISRHLSRALPDCDLPRWLVLETTNEGRQHLHGAIAIADQAQLPASRDALVKAGGLWVGPGQRHQLDLEPQRNPDAWGAYPLKREAQTRRHVREARGLPEDAPVNIACWSKSLIADAKRLLSEERRLIGRR